MQHTSLLGNRTIDDDDDDDDDDDHKLIHRPYTNEYLKAAEIMLLHRTTLLILWMSFTTDVVHSAIDFEECKSETNALTANSEALAEAYPSNVTCTFLNETYCLLDLFNLTKDYARVCYEVDGRVVYYTTSGYYNTTTNEGNRTVQAYIANDPVCISSNCSTNFFLYSTSDRFEILLNDTLDFYAFETGQRLYTSFTGMCALDTLELQDTLPQVAMPYEKCNTTSCTKNYTASAEVFSSICRGKGGDAMRQTQRMATCQDADGVETIVTQINVPYCFSAQCSLADIADEQTFLDEQWSQPIGFDYANCGYTYGAWETVNTTTDSSGDNANSNGGSWFDFSLWQWTTLLAIWMVGYMAE